MPSTMRMKRSSEDPVMPPAGLAEPMPVGSTALLAEFLATTGPEDIYRSNSQTAAQPIIKPKKSIVNLNFLRKRPTDAERTLPDAIDKRVTSTGKPFFAIRTAHPTETVDRAVQADAGREAMPRRPQRPDGILLSEYDQGVMTDQQDTRGTDTFQVIEYDFGKRSAPQTASTFASGHSQHTKERAERHSPELRSTSRNASISSLQDGPPLRHPGIRGASVTTTITAGSRSIRTHKSGASTSSLSVHSQAERPLSLDDSLEMLASMSDHANSERGDFHSPALSGVSPMSGSPVELMQPFGPLQPPSTPERSIKPDDGATPRVVPPTITIGLSPTSMTGKLRMAAAEHAATRRIEQNPAANNSVISRPHTTSMISSSQARLIAPISPERAQRPLFSVPDVPSAQTQATQGGSDLDRPESIDSGLGKTPRSSEDLHGQAPLSGEEALKQRLAKLEERNEALERVLIGLLTQQLNGKDGTLQDVERLEQQTSSTQLDMAHVRQALGQL
ncbi:hypothetical protein BCR37DRAFT_376310 [Protomyces lactucae-debilis]|uniref:Uncharacterized protein n=1 Tax=Protomyces lactucae-debilis TaxID=2754530 RepID=A0A1Y2FSL5_PROLT|nr:uncharacterized protein BCR37DRAFT_376310 [Protomyces lactucae-debilis]ORY86973.1 hypothetical protein BCR37DRAFT_376310 [Protomyces lactucae-debilis]